MAWSIWIDRGGTFTDVVARAPDRSISTFKLLSEDKARYDDPVVEAIKRLGDSDIDSLRVGTTVATNALLEGRGEPTVLVTTRGFGDALWIGYQSRPKIFDLHIARPAPVYSRVVEVDERIGPSGQVLTPLDETDLRGQLESVRKDGITSVAVAFMHAYAYPAHERAAMEIAHEAGFRFVTASHDVSPLIRFVPRGQTTVVDAYLTPIIRKYFEKLSAHAADSVFFMQSNGGLTAGNAVRGKDVVYSGPAGGVVGMRLAGEREGLIKLIGLDMGGTSTDVSVFDGDIQLREETIIRDLRLRSPSIDIHSVAAGGGSVVGFDGMRLRVGDDSAGSDPGPAAYGRGGPLTITDCHVLLGRLQPDLFPKVFGQSGTDSLDSTAVERKFAELAGRVAKASRADVDVSGLAHDFLQISVQKMAQAVKRVTVSRGLDPAEFALVAFGGAAAQNACAVADELGIQTVVVPPAAGLLSALGIGYAEIKDTRKAPVEALLDDLSPRSLQPIFERLAAESREAVEAQLDAAGDISQSRFVYVAYENSDDEAKLPFAGAGEIHDQFVDVHRRRFGFLLPDQGITVRSIEVTTVGAREGWDDNPDTQAPGGRIQSRMVWFAGERVETPFLYRDGLKHTGIQGPAVIIDPDTTTVVPPHWIAKRTESESIQLTRRDNRDLDPGWSTEMHPTRLEIFGNLFMHIAERMGDQLQRTARSVNVKERLDYSCAVFDETGNLIANAPHIPVHLGAMSDTVQYIIARVGAGIGPGDSYVSNNPFAGGTHLPDLTVVSPVFIDESESPIAFVASRAHHADIGGITPGSMPATSSTITEEGVLFDCFRITRGDRFLSDEIVSHLLAHPYPARDPETNAGDLMAQVAANRVGISELGIAIDRYGIEVTHAYMGHLRTNAASLTQKLVRGLDPSPYTVELDSGQRIMVSIDVDSESGTATIDFTGTSKQQSNNFNAPTAITHAAILYVIRCLSGGDMPLNAGCLDPLHIKIPEGCMLNPKSPAAVAAGNVETSQCIVDALLGAIGALAESQGTMNNVSFGDERRPYYETICGGTGAGPDFEGASAVQSHMTNSRITDPEILESRMPVLLREFSVRRGSGGEGRRRGGNGAVREIEFLEPVTLSILSNRRRVSPHGLEGGNDGRAGENRLIRAGGTAELLSNASTVEVQTGDRIRIETPGGGGFGDPTEG